MSASDAESQRRIATHRRMRDGKGFETLECPTDLATASTRCAGRYSAGMSVESRWQMRCSWPAKAGRIRFAKSWAGLTHSVENNDHVIIVTTQRVRRRDFLSTGDRGLYRLSGRAEPKAGGKLLYLVIEAQAGIPTALKGELPSCLQNSGICKGEEWDDIDYRPRLPGRSFCLDMPQVGA